MSPHALLVRCPLFERRCRISLSDLAAVSDHDGGAGLSAGGADGLDGLHNVHALRHVAEYDVLAVQPGGHHGAQEELHGTREES